jgi:hypothetical protein
MPLDAPRKGRSAAGGNTCALPPAFLIHSEFSMFGIVVSSFPEKGFCWIAPNGVKGKLHFGPHRELVEFSRIPPVGERVDFDSQNGERGLYAARIRPVSFS